MTNYVVHDAGCKCGCEKDKTCYSNAKDNSVAPFKGVYSSQEPPSSLEGLPVELRKAVKCMQTHYPADKKAHSGDCVYWLPAGLVGKEIRRIKGFQKDVIIDFLNRLRETCGFNICEEHNRARFNCPDYIKLLDEYGITYEKLKRKRED